MAHIHADRVYDTTTTTGTSDITVLNAPPDGFRTFDAVCAAADTFWYCIAHQNADEWEVGRATYGGSHVFERTAVIASSNGNAAVNFSAGVKDTWITIPALISALGSNVVATIASAATVDIGASYALEITITGTTTITSFGTVPNKWRIVRFAGALTLTHNATTLILPTGANITTAAGDTAIFTSDGSGNWLCVAYQRANGLPLTAPTAASESTAGIVELSTAAETATGTDNTRAVHPAGAAAVYSKIARTINAQTGASYTLELTDSGNVVTMDNGSANTLEIPPNGTVAFPVGTQIDGAQIGAGQTTVTPGSGVTIISENSKTKVAARYGGFTMLKLATNTWLLQGNLSS